MKHVEACPEIEQLVFEIRSGPEQGAIQILASNRADQPFHKRMGQGNIGDGFNLGHLQYPQIGLVLGQHHIARLLNDWPAYFARKMAAARDRRKAALAGLSTPEQVDQRIAVVRSRL